MPTPRTRTYLWAHAAVAALVAWLAPSTALAGDPAAGKALYTVNCVACHGETGKGDGVVGRALNPPPRDFSAAHFMFDTDGDGKTGTDADIKNVIQKGAGAFGGSPLMAPWPVLTDADIENLIAYIRTFHQ
jgi:mono/diheme cytochrome c family protein